MIKNWYLYNYIFSLIVFCGGKNYLDSLDLIFKAGDWFALVSSFGTGGGL